MAGSKHIILILIFISLVSFNEIYIVSAGKIIRKFHKLPLGLNQHNPETIAFDCKNEGPYVGISDGRILKWQGEHTGWTQFAATSSNRSSSCDGVTGAPMEQYCGRPLGLKFDLKTCDLYIADSSLGLMKVGPNGGNASLLANSAEGIPFEFTNSLDIDHDNGVIYFTDSSTKYHRWELVKLPRVPTKDIEHSGRFMKYDIKTGKVIVLLRDLCFANGVALSKKKDFVLIAESGTYIIHKYWITGPKAGTCEVFPKLSGLPDNINIDVHGYFWIALRYAKSIKINELGKILETLENDEIVDPSDIQELNGRLWIGFVDQPYVYHTI